MPRVPASSKASPATTAASSPSDASKWQPRQQNDRREKSELERLLSEARERKRQLEREPASKSASSAVRPESARKTPPESPELRPTTPEFRPVSMRVEPLAEHRHKQEAIHKPVAQPRKQFVPAPPMQRQEAPPSATLRHKIKEKAGHEVAARAAKRFEGMGGLDLDDIRSGIIIAEILGPPKGLGDIDSRVI